MLPDCGYQLHLSILLMIRSDDTHLASLIRPSDRLQDPLTRFRIINQRVALRPVNKLEMLGARLPKDGFFGWHIGVV